MTIYVGNLNYQASEQDLMDLFSEYGEVKEVKIIKDHNTGRPRGFAFVEMEDEQAITQAVDALNDKEFMQRTLVVNKARPRSNTDRH